MFLFLLLPDYVSSFWTFDRRADHGYRFNCTINMFVVITADRRQSKTLILSTNIDKKSVKTVFSIAICCQSGDKWQLKILFLPIFDARWTIVKSVFDCCLPGVVMVRVSFSR